MTIYNVLMRAGLAESNELAIAREYFSVYEHRCAVPSGKVIGRYAVLPYYRELEIDLQFNGASLLNSYQQHRYVANVGNWYRDLEGLTPQTWPWLNAVPDSAFPVVVKGETNSKKDQWRTHMFAKDRQEAVRITDELSRDGLLKDQQVYYRRFEDFYTYFDACGGMPVTKEFRVFVCYGQVLTKAYYWSPFTDDIKDRFGQSPDPEEIPEEFLQEVIDRVGKNCNGYVIDVAHGANGQWRVVELNDLQMSGLSETDPHDLYRELRRAVQERG
jgi:hypothetical protein